jgi:hypothetical protein
MEITDLAQQNIGGHEGQTPDTDPKLKELKDQEIDMALADLDCREEVDYTLRVAEVTTKLEERFVKDHREEFDALEAAVAQGR